MTPIICTRKQDGYAETRLFLSADELREFDFSPDYDYRYLRVEVSGDTYAARKDAARELVMSIGEIDEGGLSWGEVSWLLSYIEGIGRRYGLLSEFRKEGIL